MVFNILNVKNGSGTISLGACWRSVIQGTFLFMVILLQTGVTRVRKLPE